MAFAELMKMVQEEEVQREGQSSSTPQQQLDWKAVAEHQRRSILQRHIGTDNLRFRKAAWRSFDDGGHGRA